MDPKRLWMALFGVVLAVLLAGCSEKRVDELYQLPQQSENYLNLQNKIDEVIDGGAEYSAPTSGSNRQSVQLYDIDGDGIGEALAFFMQSGTEKPLKIYIYKQQDGYYEQVSVIEGEGTAIDSIVYSDVTGDGYSEIIVGWKMESELQMFNVYSLVDMKPVSLASNNYSQFIVGDMTRDGVDGLVTLEYNNLEQTGLVSLYSFDWDGNTDEYSAAISPGITAITNIEMGLLKNDFPALYIEAKYYQDDQEKAITDIFAFTAGRLKNVTADDSGVSRDTITVYPASWTSAIGLTDINSDRINEVPEPIVLKSPEETDSSFYVIRWYTFNNQGVKDLAMTTYHNYSDGWYIELPDAWVENLVLSRDDDITGERAIVFSYKEGNEYRRFMTIYTLTGDNKSERSKMDGRTILRTGSDRIFSFKVLDDLPDGMSISELVNRFVIIETSWD